MGVFCEQFKVKFKDLRQYLSQIRQHRLCEMSLRGPCYGCLTDSVTVLCSRCQRAVYCTDECRSKHWKLCHYRQCSGRGGLIEAPLGDDDKKPYVVTTRFQTKGRAYEQQDSYLGMRPYSVTGDEVEIIAVIDGFGSMTGRLAAQTASTVLGRHAYDARNPQPTLRAALDAVNQQLSRDRAIKLDNGGVSCALAMFIEKNNELWVASVGECRAMIIRDNRVVLTTTQHQWDPEEVAQRDIAVGTPSTDASKRCWLDTSKTPPEMVMRTDTAQLRSRTPRALGPTRLRECGLTAEPDVLRFDIVPGSDRLIMGTAGVWTVLRKPDVVEALLDEFPPKPDDGTRFGEAVIALLNDEAQALSSSSSSATPFADNATLVVGSFKTYADRKRYQQAK